MITLAELTHAVQAGSPALASALLSSGWQGLLLAGGVGLALRVVRRVSPTVRASLWAAVLLLLLALPVLTLALHPETGAPGAVVPHAGVHLAQVWSVGLLVAWAALSLLRALQLGWQAVRLSGLAARATPVVVEGELATLLQGRRRATLCVSAEVDRPSVSGFFGPRVLLPAGLLQTLSLAELQQVVLHEMEHLRRGDDWWNLLQQISLVLLPLQPALLWVDRELCRERELACDDGVLAATRQHKAYAACLVKLAEDSMRRKGVALALSALGTRARESELVSRVRRILAGPERPGRQMRTRVLVAAMAVATMTCAALLVQSPEWIHFDSDVQRTTEAETALPTVLRRSPGATSVAEPAVQPMMQSVAENGIARPLLTRAVMPQRARSGSLLTNVGARASHNRESMMAETATRRVKKLVPARVGTPLRVLQPKISEERRSTQKTPLIKTALRTGDVPEPGHLVVTEFEISQPVYAAVAVGGGWLVLQL